MFWICPVDQSSTRKIPTSIADTNLVGGTPSPPQIAEKSLTIASSRYWTQRSKSRSSVSRDWNSPRRSIDSKWRKQDAYYSTKGARRKMLVSYGGSKYQTRLDSQKRSKPPWKGTGPMTVLWLPLRTRGLIWVTQGRFQRQTRDFIGKWRPLPSLRKMRFRKRRSFASCRLRLSISHLISLNFRGIRRRSTGRYRRPKTGESMICLEAKLSETYRSMTSRAMSSQVSRVTIR